VIVFEEPIKLSKAQIEVLSRIPSGSSPAKDIRNTLPPLQDLPSPDFKIYYNKKAHQFRRNDGVNEDSVSAFARRKSGGVKIFYNDFALFKLLGILFISILFV